jgi:hypothetical protein
VSVRVDLPLQTASVHALVAAAELRPGYPSEGGVEVRIPRVATHEVLCFEVA